MSTKCSIIPGPDELRIFCPDALQANARAPAFLRRQQRTNATIFSYQVRSVGSAEAFSAEMTGK